MKKIIISLGLVVLLSGCGFGSGPAEESSAETTFPSVVTSGTTLNDDLFVALSAEILCLPSNNPVASDEEIENLAKQILADASVSEEDFSVYQQTIEADPASKNLLSLAIIGKMDEFCQIVEGGEIPVEPEEIEPPVDLENNDEDIEPSVDLENNDEEIEIPVNLENNEEEIITESEDEGSGLLIDFEDFLVDEVSETPAE
jgi:hypothetical protein